MKQGEKELNSWIKRAYEAATPDVLESVLSCCKTAKGRVIPMNKKTGIAGSRLIRLIAAAVAVLLVLAGGVGVIAANSKSAAQVYATVSMDVNPSLEIELNKNEKVLSITALNVDAEKIMGNMNLKGSSIDVAVNALIGSMLRNGYLSDIANSVLVTVDNSDAQHSEELQRRLADEIEAALASNGGGAVISQSADTRADIKTLASSFGITSGKVQLIYSIIAQSPRYSVEQLAGLSINELNLLYTKYGKSEPNDGRINEGTPSENAYIGRDRAIEIALELAGVSADKLTEQIDCELEYEHGRMVYEVELVADKMEYSIDLEAITGAVLGFEVEYVCDYEGTTAEPSSDPASYIGEDAAMSIAFAHAGVDGSETMHAIAKLESDDGRMVYDIEFSANGFEYDLDVDAVTGRVMAFDMKAQATATPSQSSEPVPTETPKPTAAPGYIGSESAKLLAFERAGILENEATRVKIELERDDGRLIYDIEFKANGSEYDIDIDAITGAVLKFDMDDDDDHDDAHQTQAPDQAYIDEETAKSIAFSRAGVSKSETKKVKVELEREKGRLIYEIEFKAKDRKYEVEIDAITGAVIDFDMD